MLFTKDDVPVRKANGTTRSSGTIAFDLAKTRNARSIRFSPLGHDLSRPRALQRFALRLTFCCGLLSIFQRAHNFRLGDKACRKYSSRMPFTEFQKSPSQLSKSQHNMSLGASVSGLFTWKISMTPADKYDRLGKHLIVMSIHHKARNQTISLRSLVICEEAARKIEGKLPCSTSLQE